MGETIEFQRPDGKTSGGYLAGAREGQGTTGVVLLQEWWGIASPKSHVQHTADELAKAGYRVLAPDLFHGKAASTQPEAQALMQGLDWQAGGSEDNPGAVDHPRPTGSSQGAVVGVFMGR